MNKRIIPLLLAFCFFNGIQAQGSIFRTYLNGDNLEEIVELIDTRYSGVYGNGVTRAEVKTFLKTLTDYTDFSSECTAGSLHFDYDSPLPDVVNLYFTWPEPNISNEYYGTYLDLRTNEKVYRSSPQFPEVSFTIHGSTTYKLMAINVRCEGIMQDVYTIIIIERDLMFGNSTNNDSNPFLREDSADEHNLQIANNFKIFPNPAKADFHIQLALEQEELTSLYLIHGTSGQLVKTIIDEGQLQANQYDYRIPTDDLSAGMYYVVLQTKNKREMKKVVVVK